MKIKTTSVIGLAFGITFYFFTGNLASSAETPETLPAKSPQAPQAEKEKEVTPLSILGSEPFVFRKVGDAELRLHVVKPKGWSNADHRSCLIFFFGGGFQTGTPDNGIGWAKWAANLGMVGIAPDYRTRTRFGGSPEDCVADGRAAVQWVEDHAAELGIDPKKVICGGFSAGGEITKWTAVSSPGPGTNDSAPGILPAALVLLSPGAKLGNYPMTTNMPPTILFHATGDKTIPYTLSVAFRDRMVKNGNTCELVTFEGLGHTFFSSKFGPGAKVAKRKTETDAAAFLASLGLVEKQKLKPETEEP